MFNIEGMRETLKEECIKCLYHPVIEDIIK